MKAHVRLAVLVGGMVVGAAALADTDCSDPVASWQQRDVLRQKAEQYGWTVQRIKVDDGCYEVRGLDRKGNNVKAKFAPASLRILSLEIGFGAAADASDYVGPRPGPGHAKGEWK